MAKVGFWLRGSVGKLAGASLSKGPYGTVAREVVTPKNPNSQAQVIQRIIMSTVGKAYSRMKAITDHSFEGIQYGAKTMAAFMQVNLKDLREAVANAYANEIDLNTLYAFTPIGSSAFMANPYTIAQGSLPSVPVLLNAADYTPYIKIGAGTYQDVIDEYGLQRGDQLTFCVINHRSGNSNNHDFAYVRVILDPRNADGSAADLSTPFVSNGTINLPSHMNEGNFSVLAVEDDKLFFNISGATQCAAGVIVSRDLGGQWLRSNTTMTVLRQADGVSFQTALDRSKARLAIQTESDQYLNNAGVSNATGEEIASALTYNVSGSGSVVLYVDEEEIANGSDVLSGKTVVVQLTPSEGQYAQSATLNGSALSISNNTITFVMPAQAATLRVVFATPTYTLRSNAVGEGTVVLSVGGETLANPAQVGAGAVITVTATPASGQVLRSLNWNGTSIESGGTFTMPAAAVVVSATFGGQSAGGDGDEES